MENLKKYIDNGNCKQIIKILNNNNFDIFFEKLDNYGNSILLYSVCKNHSVANEILQYINNQIKCPIKKNKILNQVNVDGNTALYLAVQNKYIELATELYNNGVSIDIVNKKGETIKVYNDCKPKNKKKYNDNVIDKDDVNEIDNDNDDDDDDYNDDNEKNNKFEKINKYEKRNNYYKINKFDEINNFDKINNLSNFNKVKKFNNDEEYENDDFVKRILNKFKETQYKSPFYFSGGKNDSETLLSIEFDKNNITDNENMYSGGKHSMKNYKQKFKKHSSELHDKTINEIIKIGYDIEKAKIIKAGLYSIVKEKYGDSNNRVKAEKLLEMVTKKNIEDLDIENLKQVI